MAFSFGGASSSAAGSSFSFATPAASSSAFSFAGTSTPATPFGQQQSAPSLFGGASTPAVGASSTSLFGAASAPAFGASSGSLFGAASTPAFGAASSTSLFGSSTAGAFGASSGGLFGSTATPSLFGGTPASQAGALTVFSAPAFGASQPQGAFGSTFSSSTFGAQPQQQQQQQQQQQVSGALSNKEGRPLTHATKWDDVSPQGQAYLLELEKIVAQYREECRQLDGNARLWGDEGRTLKQEMAADERALRQALAGLEAALKGDLQTLAVFREKAVALLHDTEQVVRTFQRTHRWRQAGKVLPGQALPPGIREQLNGPIILPSMYLRRTTKAFQETMEQYRALVAELEVLLPPHLGSRKQQQDGSKAPAALAALPVVLHNLHDFFNHVAARLEKLHDGVATAREAFLERRREAGDMTDPFAEADRREHLKRKATQAKIAIIPPSQTQEQGAPTPVASAPAASPAGGGLFGGASTPSLFGATAIPATSMPGAFGGGGLFGASTPAWGAPANSTPGSTSRRGRTRK